jgi:DNA primase
MSEQIPREFIQQLLSRVEIVDLIDDRITLTKKTGQNFFACCPFHNEKSASFSVSQPKQFFYCFGCGAHGNAIDFLMQYDRLTFPETIDTLARQLGIEVPKEAGRPARNDNEQALYPLAATVAQFYQKQLRQHPQAHLAIDYLKQRGITGEIAKTFGLGFAPPGWDNLLQALSNNNANLKQQLNTAGMLIKKDDGGYYDRFRDRIIFPILDRQGRTIGFGGRVIDQGEPKYLNSPETPIFQKGHELYGLYQTLQHHRQLPRALIVEGYMDVIALFQHGINYAVATLGTATTAHHLQKLSRYTSDIIFCFDGDNAGRTAAWRALQVALSQMRDGLQLRFMFLPDGEDPDSLVRKEGKEQFEQRLQKAMTLADFFFQTLAQQADLNSMEGRARLIKLAKEHLETLPESMFKEMMFNELAKKARMPQEQLTTKKTQTTQSTATPANKKRSPSTLRLATTLLVQHPELIAELTEPLPILDLPGIDVFYSIVSTIRLQPDITTGSLLENWRDQKEGATIAKLAQVDHMIPANGVKNEFLGAIIQLKKLAQKQLIDNLLARAAIQGLSDPEKQELRQLIEAQNA